MRPPASHNIDEATITGFGAEWDAFDQSGLGGSEHRQLFDHYFRIFSFESLPTGAEGFDLGCGSGRWAMLVADQPQVGRLHCIDPAAEALAVAQRRATSPKVDFHLAAADTIPLPDASQDFGYSLGVLHHVPDTAAALKACTAKLKVGAPFLLYLYYRFDKRPLWFRALWRASDVGRRGISRLPFPARKAVTGVIAAAIYWPLARSAKLLERMGASVGGFPLSGYRDTSFYTMRTDALDRFGTRLEQRFTRPEIAAMMADAGLTDIRFSDRFPFWVAVGRRA